LADYQSKLAELKAADVSVVALSVDPLDKAHELAEQNHLEFPLAYGLKVPEDAQRIGAWWDEKRPMIQPSEFLLGEGGRILSATYSSGPIGRVKAEDALTLVRFFESRRK
jgi:peroxiredoxin